MVPRTLVTMCGASNGRLVQFDVSDLRVLGDRSNNRTHVDTPDTVSEV